MHFKSEQSFGNLPKPFKITQIIDLTSDSKIILKTFDNKPNLVALLESEEGKIVLKRFGWRSRFHFFISPLMYSRARMSWEIANILDTIGITPKPLYVHTNKKFGFKYENFFITKAIEPSRTFRRFILEEQNTDIINSVISNLAISIAKMHELSIYHRDLTTGNFLIDDDLRVYIVDLNRALHLNKLSLSQRLYDLSKIHFPKKAKLNQNLLAKQFFRYYKEKSEIHIDWETEYWKYRKIIVNRRKYLTRIKHFFRSNN